MVGERFPELHSNILGIILMIFVLFGLLIVGVALVFGAVVIDWTFDEAVPELQNLGMVGNSNFTEIADMTIVPLNNVVQSFTWLAGVFYAIMLLMCFGLAFGFRFTGNKWLAGFFVACMLLLVMGSIFISNIYEDFYDDPGEMGERLKEHQMLSWFLIYSPIVVCIIGFFCGLIMFTGEGGEVSL